MTDIVERLRNLDDPLLALDAADEIERLRHCIRGLTEQNAALVWELQGHGKGEPIPDILVQNAALTGENMVLKHDLAACQKDAKHYAHEFIIAKDALEVVTRERDDLALLVTSTKAELQEQLAACQKERDDMAKAYGLLNQQLADLRAAPAVPEGWQLVPKEPTEEMLAAYNNVAAWLESNEGTHYKVNAAYDQALGEPHYKAMLAAAPEMKK